jgi:hypothetical protein
VSKKRYPYFERDSTLLTSFFNGRLFRKIIPHILIMLSEPFLVKFKDLVANCPVRLLDVRNSILQPLQQDFLAVYRIFCIKLL